MGIKIRLSYALIIFLIAIIIIAMIIAYKATLGLWLIFSISCIFIIIKPRWGILFILFSVIVIGSQRLLPVKIFGIGIPISDILLFSTIIGCVLSIFIRKDHVLEKGKFHYLFIIFAIIVIFSVLYGIYKGNDLAIIRKELRLYIYFIAGYLIAIYVISSMRHIYSILGTIFFGTTVASLISIYLYLFVGRSNYVNIFGAQIFSGTYTRVTFLGADRFFMIIPLIVLCLLNYPSIKRRIFNKYLLSFLMTLSLVALLLTFTRSLWYSFLTSLLILFFFFVKIKRLPKMIPVFIFSSIAFLLLILAVHNLFEDVLQRFNSIFLFNKDITILYRRDEFINVIEKIKRGPIFGYGLGGGDFLFLDPVIKIWNLKRASHNSFLNILLKMGIIGLVSFLWIFFKAFKIGISYFKKTKDREIKGIISGLLISIFALLLSSISIFSISMYEYIFFTTVCIAIIDNISCQKLLIQKKGAHQN